MLNRSQPQPHLGLQQHLGAQPHLGLQQHLGAQPHLGLQQHLGLQPHLGAQPHDGALSQHDEWPKPNIESSSSNAPAWGALARQTTAASSNAGKLNRFFMREGSLIRYFLVLLNSELQPA